MSNNIEISISSRLPIFISADADAFGRVFAGANSDEQVNILRAMVEHMREWPTQWDHISIELELDENKEVRNILREVLFPRGEQ